MGTHATFSDSQALWHWLHFSDAEVATWIEWSSCWMFEQPLKHPPRHSFRHRNYLLLPLNPTFKVCGRVSLCIECDTMNAFEAWLSSMKSPKNFARLNSNKCQDLSLCGKPFLCFWFVSHWKLLTSYRLNFTSSSSSVNRTSDFPKYQYRQISIISQAVIYVFLQPFSCLVVYRDNRLSIGDMDVDEEADVL